jgi:hypothetical protein
VVHILLKEMVVIMLLEEMLVYIMLEDMGSSYTTRRGNQPIIGEDVNWYTSIGGGG